MNLLDGMKQNSTITNTKGSNYYATTYDSNLDLFTKITRFNSNEEIIRIFDNALKENECLALANLLYILDIRNGKGERKIFKIIFNYLAITYPQLALKVLPYIGQLGRFDYILQGIKTPIEDNVIELIKKQLQLDINSENPSLLGKWLPSLRTHGKNNVLAKYLSKKLDLSEKEYRKLLAQLRSKINVVEKNLTEKQYNNINFEEVPTKAMLKYRYAYSTHMSVVFEEYLDKVKNGKSKINTEGLFSYEIIGKLLKRKDACSDLYDLMWSNQKDVLKGVDANILVMADTSGSMLSYGCIPYATSIGMALYTAERNTGIFKNHFLTFSSKPYLCEVKGNNLEEKLSNIPHIVENTNIDSAFELLLKLAKKYHLQQNDLPSHLLIISDMEFDEGVYTKNGTNFDGWKNAFEKEGYQLPIIIFWNVAGNAAGVPVTKFESDVCMVSGFSTNILENLLSLEDYTPIDIMMDKLAIYLELLKVK